MLGLSVFLLLTQVHEVENGVYLGVRTYEFFLCLGVIVCVLYIVSGLFVVLLILCFTSLVSFTGFYTEDEPENGFPVQ